MATMVHNPITRSQVDYLEVLSALKDNWDGEGATAINRKAIANVSKLMKKVRGNSAASVRLYPTPLGAVMVCLETNNGRIKGEMGDREMSYFVKRSGMTIERHSFEPVCSETLLTFANNLQSLL